MPKIFKPLLGQHWLKVKVDNSSESTQSSKPSQVRWAYSAKHEAYSIVDQEWGLIVYAQRTNWYAQHTQQDFFLTQ